MDSQIIIDRRPITVVLFARTYRFFLLVAIALAFRAFLLAEPWAGLSPEGYKAIGAFLLCMVLWLSQLIPLAITGLLAIVIIPMLGILPSKEVFGYFGNEAVFFILGAFILSAAIMRTGLSTRLSILFLRRASRSPKRLLFMILFATAFLSCLMSEHAVAAFFFPIVLEIARALEFEPFGGEYGKTLFLAMAWGCIIGGIITFLGGARAPLAIGILNEMTHQQVGFFVWMKTTVMAALPIFVAAWLLLTRYFKIDVESVEAAQQVLEKKKKQIGRLSFREFMVAIILLGAIGAWMLSAQSGHMANVAIMAVVFLFVFRLVSWKDIEEYVNWGIILMYGGAIALGRAVDASGALQWVAQEIIFIPEMISQHFGWSPLFWLLALMSLITIFLTDFFSNAAVVALLLPISIKMAIGFGADPALMAYAIAIPAGQAFMMPMGTPAVAMAYSSGYLKVSEIAIPGFILNLVGWLAFVLMVKFWWPFLGFTV